METVKQNLEYILKSLQNGTHKESGVIIELMLVETIQEVKETIFIYEVPFVSAKEDYHFSTYEKRSRKAKASLISDLQELQTELKTGRNINIKRCLAVIQKILHCNLYQDEINKTISKWVNVGNNPTKVRTLKVK
jgi:hypothetical protein